jgi:hypothetical protein
MKQQVDITMKLSLWLDASMDEDEIVTHVRSALPSAFGEELTEMKNPVDILHVRQEAEINGNVETLPIAAASVAYQLANDHATYGPNAGKYIVTSADHEKEFSEPMSKRDAVNYAAALSACQMVIDRWGNGELAEAARACSAAICEVTRRVV